MRPIFEECLDRSREMGDLAGIGESLIMAARLAAANGQLERAARLLGAAHGYHANVYLPIEVMTRADLERQMAALRDRMGTGTFDAAWAEGYEMYSEQAIAYVLDKPLSQGAGA